MTKLDLDYLEAYKKKFIYSCPKCSGTNYLCDCWKGFNLEILKISAKIPIKYRPFTLDQITHPQVQTSKNKIATYIESLKDNRNNGKCLYLNGSKGLAKTVFGNIILIEALKQGLKAYYIESLNVCIDDTISGWKGHRDSVSMNDIISGYDFIVVDGIGEGVSNVANATESLKRSFRNRYNNMLPVIFISNIKKDDIVDLTENHIIRLFSACTEDISFKGFNYEENVLSKVKKT